MSYNEYDRKVQGLISPLPWRCELGNNWFDAKGKKIAEANHPKGDWGEYPVFYNDLDAAFYYGWNQARDSLLMAPGLRLHENEIIRQIRQDAEDEGFKTGKQYDKNTINLEVNKRLNAYLKRIIGEIEKSIEEKSGD